MAGILYLVATPIGNLEDMTFRAVRVLKEVDLIAAEDTRNSIKLLNHFEIQTPMTSYHEFNKYEKGKKLVEKLLDGMNIAVITDAREWIEKQTKVVIPPNKRNGRKQATHLKIARFTLEIMNEDRGKALQGRPDKAKIVEEWRESNPLGTKADCIRETGLAKHTVYKWWK